MWHAINLSSNAPQIHNLLCCVNLMEIIVAGIEPIAGDMFVSIPKGDGIFMKVSSI